MNKGTKTGRKKPLIFGSLFLGGYRHSVAMPHTPVSCEVSHFLLPISCNRILQHKNVEASRGKTVGDVASLRSLLHLEV